MLIGHYAPALALQRGRSSVKLWHLFLATQFVDVWWAIFVFAGIEKARIVPGFTASNDLDLWYMPYTHSLTATLVWAAIAFVVWRVATGNTGDAAVIALAVASHFFADLIVHVHDLPILHGEGAKLGFGLWQHKIAALVVETGLFGAGALFWWWPRRAHPGARLAGAVLMALTITTAVTFFIPTPPSPAAMAATVLATYAITAAVAAWIDRISYSSARRIEAA